MEAPPRWLCEMIHQLRYAKVMAQIRRLGKTHLYFTKVMTQFKFEKGFEIRQNLIWQ